MNARKKYESLPHERNIVNAKDRLFNHVIECLRKKGVGFTPVQVETTGNAIVKTLTGGLWYIDPHLQKLHSRGITIPEMFSDCNGFNDWKVQKRKEPMILLEDLEVHIAQLVDMVSMPWFSNEKFKNFKRDVDEFIEGLSKYAAFLKDQRIRTAEVHASEKPVRSLTDSWTLEVEKGDNTEVKREYAELKNALDQVEAYEPIFLDEFEPRDRIERRNWIKNIKMPFPIKIYTHHHGNYFGNFTFTWKIDENSHGEGDLEAIDIIRQDLPVFSTRAVRREFIYRYSNVSPPLKPAVLRDVYRFLTQDASSAESKKQSEVDKRVAEFLVTADEPGLFYDLRKQNGRPADEQLNPFWDELKKYLEEVTVVHERRQTQHMYMPFAVSMEDLVNTVNQRLAPGSKTPSVSWVRLNFWPMNSYTRAALCYTGRFDVKYSVQQRLLRSKHPDSEFAFNQFRMMKEMAIHLRDVSDFICLDDKAVVPIGEPGNPVSSGVRPNHQALIPSGARLVALDHDFHIHGAIPSVLFHVDIPEQYSDSFYKGRLHVTVKDKVFQPSSAMRHTTESVSILRSVASADGINLTNPILFIYTDGGPDHRCTFFSVQIALIALFIALDLDMLVAVRTAPCQSYNNPAERCMSILNMGLQHCSLEREKMSDGMEFRVKSLSSMKKIREKADREPTMKENLKESIEPVIAKLKQRFTQLRLNEEGTFVHDAATDEQIDNITNLLELFKDENREDDTTKVFTSLKTKKDLPKYDKLKDFYKHHCRERQYSFQVKKCRSECWYCHINGWRLPDDERESVQWLPDPTLEDNRYLPFTELYGKRQTSDKDRPGLETHNVTKEVDKENTGILVAGRVRAFIMCLECGKRRCVYSKQRLSRDSLNALERVQEELVYICGNALFPPGHTLVKDVLVKESLRCSSPIEVTYYAAVREKFADICFYCGDLEVVVTDIVGELRSKYGIVRPICQTCLNDGKLPATRSALKVGQKRKQ